VASGQRYIKDTKLVTRSIAGETIIVPVASGVGDLDSIYTLNEVGSTIWTLIDGRRSVDEIVDTVGSEYEVTPEDAARDVADFITSLASEGLVSVNEKAEA